jgi:hypothetical protein
MHPTPMLPTNGADPTRPTRRVDGRPETDADRRFFDLREAGYTGPIDQDGFAVNELTIPPATVAEPVTPAVTLRAAARYLDRYGWVQGSYYDGTATVFTPSCCLVGALGMVCYGGPVDAPALNHDDPGFGEFHDAYEYLDLYLLARYELVAYEFNDARGRTADQVTAALRAAADEWDRHHQPVVSHVDYPHQPGALYDCPACEATCFCADGVVCVHCAIDAEAEVARHWEAVEANVEGFLFGGDA